MKRLIPLCIAMILAPAMAFGTVIVNDSWASGTRTSPPNDAGWWTSTSSSGIEVGTGFLGLVSGGSGRGIHGTFASQALNVGDTLTATFTFTTPATVVNNKSTAFRVGLFDTTGKMPDLAADLSASTGTPNPIYNGLPGYMADLDINLSAGGENITFREHNTALTTGLLLAQTGDYVSLSSGGDPYNFAANTAYTGVLSATRTAADSLDLTTTLFQGATQLSTYTATDSSGIASTFGMLAFQVNSSTFGSSSTPDTADNGIDFTNIRIEYIPIPEPSSAALLVGGLFVLGGFLRRRAQA